MLPDRIPELKVRDANQSGSEGSHKVPRRSTRFAGRAKSWGIEKVLALPRRCHSEISRVERSKRFSYEAEHSIPSLSPMTLSSAGNRTTVISGNAIHKGHVRDRL